MRLQGWKATNLCKVYFSLRDEAEQANSQTYVPFVESFIEHIWEQRLQSLIQRE